MPEVLAGATSSTVVSSIKSYAGAAVLFRRRSLLYGGRSHILPVSMPLPNFADKDFVPSLIQSVMVATQPCPSSPESRASTVCVDMDTFPSEGSGSSDGVVSVSPVEKDRVSVRSVNSGDND